MENETAAPSGVQFDEERLEKIASERLVRQAEGGSRQSPLLIRTLSSFQGKVRGHRVGTNHADSTNKGYDVDGGGDFATEGEVEIPISLSLLDGDDEGEGLQGSGEAVLSVEATKVSFLCVVPPKCGARWSASFGGRSVARRKLGHASGQCRVAYDVSPITQMHSDMHFGPNSKISLGTSTRTLSGTSFQVDVGTIPSSDAYSLTLHSHRNLLENKLKGSLFFGVDSSRHSLPFLQLGITTLLKELPTLALNVDMGVNQLPVRLCIDHDLSKDERRVLSLRVGMKGLEFKGMLRRALSKVASYSIGVRIATGRGISWLLRLERGDFCFNVPVTVATCWGPRSAIATMYLAFLSGMIDSAIGDLVDSAKVKIISSNEENEESKASLRRTASLLQLDKAREDAERQSTLMARQAASKKRAEESKDGLVIVRALYYVKDGSTLDVTTQLQFWVTDSTLYLPPTPKSNMLGFYDISGGCAKKQHSSWTGWKSYWKSIWSDQEVNVPNLFVQYKFDGDLYEISIVDHDELVLPNPSAARLDHGQNADFSS